jgi:hypothetical protein
MVSVCTVASGRLNHFSRAYVPGNTYGALAGGLLVGGAPLCFIAPRPRVFAKGRANPTASSVFRLCPLLWSGREGERALSGGAFSTTRVMLTVAWCADIAPRTMWSVFRAWVPRTCDSRSKEAVNSLAGTLDLERITSWSKTLTVFSVATQSERRARVYCIAVDSLCAFDRGTSALSDSTDSLPSPPRIWAPRKYAAF